MIGILTLAVRLRLVDLQTARLGKRVALLTLLGRDGLLAAGLRVVAVCAGPADKGQWVREGDDAGREEREAGEDGEELHSDCGGSSSGGVWKGSLND